MYTITLTPSDIKKIRNYNDSNSYNDYTLKCTKGLYCKSTFLREKFRNLINEEKSCGISDEWYACDSGDLASYRDELLDWLR